MNPTREVKPINPFVARILDDNDNVTMFEIVAHNAVMAEEMADHAEANAHDPCSNKNCNHGNAGWVKQQRAYADRLKAEAQALAQEVAAS